jgi:hypothetical protein
LREDKRCKNDLIDSTKGATMKRTIFAIMLTMLFMVGCATNKDYAAYLASQEAVAVAQADAQKARYTAFAEISKNAADPATRIAAVMALAMGGQGPQGSTQLAAPPEDSAYKWAALIMNPLTNIMSAYYGYKLGVTSSNNQAATTMASYNTFSTMGVSIERAGVAGYPYIQAPGTVTTTTNTLSGTGVIGNGSYNAPITRTCNGGNAGSATPPLVPGAGGSANC